MSWRMMAADRREQSKTISLEVPIDAVEDCLMFEAFRSLEPKWLHAGGAFNLRLINALIEWLSRTEVLPEDATPVAVWLDIAAACVMVQVWSSAFLEVSDGSMVPQRRLVLESVREKGLTVTVTPAIEESKRR